MSFRAQQTILARTSLSREDGLLLAVANPHIGAAQLALDSVASTQVPRMVGCGGRCRIELGVVHPLPAFVAGSNSQPQDRQYRFFCCPVALAFCATSLQRTRFHRAPSLPYFPSFHSVTRFGAYPAPGGTRRSASHCVRPAGFGFQKIFSAISAKSAERKDFPNLPKKHVFGLGSGAHSRRFAHECPEGTSGKYKQEKNDGTL